MRWCRLIGHDLWNSRCTRCDYVRPFVVGRVYAPEDRPGPYPTGHYDGSQLAGLAKPHASGSLTSAAESATTEKPTTEKP